MRIWIPVEIAPVYGAHAPCDASSPCRRPWIGMNDIIGGLIGLLLLFGFLALLAESL